MSHKELHFLSYKEPNSLLFEELFSLSYNELHSLSSKELHSLSCKEKSCSPSHLLFQDPIYSRNYILLIQGIKGLFKDRESDLMLVSDQAVFFFKLLGKDRKSYRYDTL